MAYMKRTVGIHGQKRERAKKQHNNLGMKTHEMDVIDYRLLALNARADFPFVFPSCRPVFTS